MAVATVIGWGFGTWLDGKLDTTPWMMLLFLLFGVGAGFRGLLKTANEYKRAFEESDKSHP